jgi:thiol-disulfide isomerase/thioredoxin
MGINICDAPNDFALPDYVSGSTVSLSDYSGKAIVLSFVCISCGWCMSWLQHLQNIHSDYDTNPNVQVIAVMYNYLDGSDGTHSGPVTSDWIAERLTAYGLTITFPLLMDGEWASSVAAQYMGGMVGPSIGFPHSYMISRGFVITNKWHRLSTANGQPVCFDSSDLTDTEYFVRHRLEDLQKDRTAWDTVLALDYSGSMNSSVTIHGVTQPKVEFLKEAASTLLKVWKDYALCSDRAGSVFFNCHASTGSALSSVLSGDHVGDMISAIETQSAQGCTAMGAGVATALDLMDASINRKFVVLFTDGIQNRNPLVYVAEISGGGATCYERHIDNIGPADYPDGAWMCICDSDGGQSDYAGSLPVNLEIVNANIHTIGIGAGAVFSDMLNQIAAATAGQFRMDVDIWPSLKEFFIETLVEMYRGSSLQVVQKGQGVLAGDQFEVVKTFRINRSAEKVTVLLSWVDAENPLQFMLCKDGVSIDLRHKVEEEPTYQFATLAFPHYQKTSLQLHRLAHWQRPTKSVTLQATVEGESTSKSQLGFPMVMRMLTTGELVTAEGDWKLVIRRSFDQPGVASAYHYMILADEKSLKFDLEIPNIVYKVGQPIPIAIRLSDKLGKQVKVFSIHAEVIRPTVSIAEMLAGKKVKMDSAGDFDKRLVSDDVIAAMRKTARDVVKLQPLHEGRKSKRKETEGRFRTFYKNTKIPGLYRIEFRIKGVSSQSGVFERTESRHIIVSDKSNRPQPAKRKIK